MSFGDDAGRWERVKDAVLAVADPVKRGELVYHLSLAEEAHERALLEDMGYDNCEVCLANRLREAWK